MAKQLLLGIRLRDTLDGHVFFKQLTQIIYKFITNFIKETKIYFLF